uniref:Transthyretin-like protein 15 n=2 Tax=Ascaris TaxID=6251 RepID=A0A9J2P4I4_ASCLU
MSVKVLLLLCVVVVVTYGKLQTITVKGQLACDNKSVQNVNVELREADTLDPDDSLGSTHSDRKGHFEVSGQEDEVGSIEPYLRITHNCDGGTINPKCTIVDDYRIPKEHINGIYDMGIVSLNIAQEVHKKTCT